MIALLGALAWAGPDLPGEVMPDRRWDFLHLDLEVTLDPDGHRVEGRATHHVRALGGPHAWVRLHQVGLDIREVQVDGRPAQGWRTGAQTLDVPVPPDRTEHVIEIAYGATPQTGMHFRGGPHDPVREVWTQGEGEDNRHWFPTWDYPNDKFTVATDVIVPDGMLAFANGALVGTASDGGRTRWTYRLDRPIVSYLVAIAAGEYRAVEVDGPVPLTFVVPRTRSDAAARHSLGVTAEQMRWMAELLDEPFPWPTYRQVFVSRFLYGGMENATLTVLADGLLLDPSDRDLDTEAVVAHELAHQWFGDLLTCYGWRELWLNEGFATFYAGRWQEHRYGAARYAAQVRRWMTAALGDPAPMAPRSWSKVDGRDNAAVYVRGASVLQMLRVHLGDAVFDAAIRRYVDDHADGLVETDDLRRALEDASGRHLGWLFDTWVHGVGVPEVDTRWSWSDGQLEVVLAQRGEATFAAPVTIEIGLADDVRSRVVWLGPGETRLALDLAEAPRWVAVDAPGGVLARWHHTQEVAAWAAQAVDSPTPHARLVALEQLGDGHASAIAFESARAVMRDASSDIALRGAAALALGALGTGEAIGALIAAAEDPDAALREVVVEALGDAPPRETRAAPTLIRVVASDPDGLVRAGALAALAAVDPDSAVTWSRRVLARPDRTPERAEHSAALAILGEHGPATDWTAWLRRVPGDASRPSRHAAARAAVAAFDRLDADRADARRGELTEGLLRLLEDPDVRARQLGIALLGRAGDARAAVALTAFAKVTRVSEPNLAAAALDAARLARSRDTAPTPEEAPDLEALRAQLETLETRLERLEEWR